MCPLIGLNSFRYYPQETCAVFSGVWGGEAIVKVCSSVGIGGANRPSTTSAGGISAGRTSTATTIGTPTGTASGGSQQTRTPNGAAGVGPLASWEMFIGLVLLAVNI